MRLLLKILLPTLFCFLIGNTVSATPITLNSSFWKNHTQVKIPEIVLDDFYILDSTNQLFPVRSKYDDITPSIYKKWGVDISGLTMGLFLGLGMIVISKMLKITSQR